MSARPESFKCSACGRPIVWVRDTHGAQIALDADPTDHGTVAVYEAGGDWHGNAVRGPQRDGMRKAGRELREPHRSNCTSTAAAHRSN